MPRLIEHADARAIGLAECTDRLATRGFDPADEESLLAAAHDLRQLGNDPNFLGLVLPDASNPDHEWMIAVDFDPAGYVKDDDAKNWKSDELLQNLKDGTEAGNERRAKLGIPPLEVTRWIEPPAYDSVKQRLVWSIEAR
jgi:uncharacterized membrane-anchored protein